MADEARIHEIVATLNDALGAVTPYKLAVVAPTDLRHVETNAHYMPKRTFDQLTANITRDGNLASLPFCWRREDGAFIVLSGNHRVDTAIAAGVAHILILYTDQRLSRAEQIAIQLSHNALVGRDNPTTLLQLWQEIDELHLKVYTGLDDDTLAAIQPVTILRVDEARLRFEEVSFLFLPTETERIKEVLGCLGGSTHPRCAAPIETFDRFFDTLLAYKEASGLHNISTALLAMLDIVEAWIDEHQTTEQGEDADATDPKEE